MRAVHLLHIMYLSNEGRSTRLPHSEFYNNDMSQSADLAQEYMIWRHLLVSSLVSQWLYSQWSGCQYCTQLCKQCSIKHMSAALIPENLASSFELFDPPPPKSSFPFPAPVSQPHLPTCC